MPGVRLALFNPSPKSLTLAILGVVMVSATVAGMLPYSKKEFVPGYLQVRGGEQRISAPIRGTVRYAMSVGDGVRVGQVLATIQFHDEVAGGESLSDSQRKLLRTKESSLVDEKRSTIVALDARTRAFEAQVASSAAATAEAEAAVATQQKSVALAAADYGRNQQLRQQGFLSSAALSKSEAELFAAKASLQAAQRSVTQTKSQMATVQADLAAHKAQATTQLAQLTRDQQSTSQQAVEIASHSSASLVASMAGELVARATADGDMVDAGQLLMKLAPAGAPLQAKLLLTPTTAGRVQVGQSVNLQLAAYPYTTYGVVPARITHIDKSPLVSDEASVLRGSGIPSGTSVVMATAELGTIPARIGTKDGLHGGMQFQAAVEVERKSLLAWMLWPLIKHFGAAPSAEKK